MVAVHILWFHLVYNMFTSFNFFYFQAVCSHFFSNTNEYVYILTSFKRFKICICKNTSSRNSSSSVSWSLHCRMVYISRAFFASTLTNFLIFFTFITHLAGPSLLKVLKKLFGSCNAFKLLMWLTVLRNLYRWTLPCLVSWSLSW